MNQTLNVLNKNEIQLYTLEKLCEPYGYLVKEAFGEFHIYTKFESWKFVPREGSQGKIKLMHGNEPGHAPHDWHLQFHRQIGLEELIRYIHEHEEAKYGCNRIRFTTDPYSA